MAHLGDFDASTVVYGKFTTYRPSTGAAFTLGGSPALSVYKDNSTTQSTTGVTLTADFDSVTGLNHYAIDTSADGTFYAAGSFFDIVVTTGTVDSVSVVGAVVASFTIRKNSALKPATAGRTIIVDASGLADANAVKVGPTGSGTAQTARDIGASVLLSTGTGTGQLDFTSGVVKSNVAQWLGTAASTPTVAGVPNVNVKTWNDLTTVALPLVPTTAGRTLDVSAGGEAGVDWANVGSPTTTLNLSGTTIATTQKVDLETIKTNPVVNAGTVTFPTTATLASTTNISAGTITTVTNVTTVNGLAAGVITATSVADGAIDRATFAADTGLQAIRSNTAQAGAGSTITLDASASATTDFYKGDAIYLTGGTGVGQYRICTAYNGATKVATITPAWATNPDVTSTFAVLPHGMADIEAILGAAVSTASAQLGVNVVSYASGQAPLQPTVASRTLDVSAGGEAGVDWANVGSPTTTVVLSGTTVKTATDVETDTADIQTRLPAALVSGRIDASVGAMAANVMTAAAAAADLTTELQSGLATQASVDTIDNFLDTEIAAIKTKTDFLPSATAGAAGGLFIAGTNAATSITTALTANLIGNVTGNLSGSVGSVTGNVGGNVVGSVGSVAAAVGLSAGDSPVMQSGTATAGGGSTITIQTALGADSLPVGSVIKITSGTGANQARVITAYVNATKVVTVDRAWTTNPDATSVYSILYAENTALGSSLKVSGVVLTDTVTTYTGNTPQTGDAFARLGAPAGASVSADVATLAGYIDTEVAAIKAKTDNLPSDPADASDIATAFSGLDVKIDAIDDYLDTEIAAIKTKTDFLPSATAGAAGGVFIAGTNAATTITTALTTTFTGNLTGSVGSVTGLTVATVHADLDDIQARLPAALVSGRIDASVGAMAANVLTATAINADAFTAAKFASDVGAEFADAVWDEAIAGHAGAGSTGEALSAAGAAGDPWITALPGAYSAGQAGYILGTNLNATVSSRATQTSVDDLPTNAELATALGTADDAILAILGTPAGASLSADVAAVKTQTAAIEVDTQDLQTRVPAALVSGRIDASVGAMASGVVTATAIAADAIGASELAADAVAEIADAVWDELLSGHAVSGSTGEALSAAGAAGDPWITALPGAYGAGTAGKIIGDNVNATISSRATQTSVDDLPTNAELATALGTADDAVLAQVALVKAKTDNLPSDPADASDIATAFSGVDVKLDTIDNFLDTEVATLVANVAAIKEYADNTVIRGTVSGTSPTTTTFTSSALSPAGVDADQFKGRIIVFDNDTTTTALRGQATDITANTGAANPLFTFTALTTAPASGDTFSVV